MGTDTWAYHSILRAIALGVQVPLEPGFVLLAKFFHSISDSVAMAVNLFSFLFFSIIAVYLFRSTRAEAIYLVGYFGPQYFIFYSMNGLRIGLASATFLLALQCWKRNQRLLYISLIGISISFHFTITLAIFVFFFFVKPLRGAKPIVLRIVASIFLLIAVYFLQEYISEQSDIYSDVSRLSVVAGLSFLLKITLLMFFVWRIPLSKGELRSKFIISMVILTICFAIALASYAGLRILDIMTWVIPLLFIYALDERKYFGRNFAIGLTLVGLVGGLGILRNISDSVAVGFSPFLPYHFIWQIGL